MKVYHAYTTAFPESYEKYIAKNEITNLLISAGLMYDASRKDYETIKKLRKNYSFNLMIDSGGFTFTRPNTKWKGNYPVKFFPFFWKMINDLEPELFVAFDHIMDGKKGRILQEKSYAKAEKEGWSHKLMMVQQANHILPRELWTEHHCLGAVAGANYDFIRDALSTLKKVGIPLEKTHILGQGIPRFKLCRRFNVMSVDTANAHVESRMNRVTDRYGDSFHGATVGLTRSNKNSRTNAEFVKVLEANIEEINIAATEKFNLPLPNWHPRLNQPSIESFFG